MKEGGGERRGEKKVEKRKILRQLEEIPAISNSHLG